MSGEAEWYCLRADGPAGPFTADEMRRRYRDRVIALDSLVRRGRAGAWLPLDRVAADLDLDFVAPDPTRPPPVPPRSAHSPQRPPPALRPKPAPTLEGRARGDFSGCSAAALVWAVVAGPVLLIVAAAAWPLWQDRAQRRALEGLVLAARPAQDAVAHSLSHSGNCPAPDAPALTQALRTLAADARVRAASSGQREDGACVLELRLRADQARADGHTLQLVAAHSGGQVHWHCAGTLPPRLWPHACTAQAARR